jgi:hypothetical protein
MPEWIAVCHMGSEKSTNIIVCGHWKRSQSILKFCSAATKDLPASVCANAV